MKWLGHVTASGRRKAYTGFWWRNLRGRDHLEYSGVGGVIILKFITRKGYVGAFI
jgi:hypothetical protein